MGLNYTNNGKPTQNLFGNTRQYSIGIFQRLPEGFIQMKEVWKDIKNYEGLYQVSNFGRVKSLKRVCPKPYRTIRERIKTQHPDRCGYMKVVLNKNGQTKTTPIHILVWDAFGNGERNGRILQVDHIDGNKENNFLSNLQLLPRRLNIVKSVFQNKNLIKSSKYNNVCKINDNRWVSYIKLNGKRVNLGTFSSEDEAYKEFLNVAKQHLPLSEIYFVQDAQLKNTWQNYL